MQQLLSCYTNNNKHALFEMITIKNMAIILFIKEQPLLLLIGMCEHV